MRFLIRVRVGVALAAAVAGLDATQRGHAGPLQMDYRFSRDETDGSQALVFRVETRKGRWYQYQVSRDLVAWSDKGNPVTGTGGRASAAFALQDDRAGFYRVVEKSKDQVWRLRWSDEFDTPGRLDPKKWEIMSGDGTQFGLPPGWGNKELQFYTTDPRNVEVMQGRLVITARRERKRGYDFTSGRIRTFSRGDWNRGRFEIRARMPQGKGMWPAIWMLPSGYVYGPWAASGEIDIMEFRGDRVDRIYNSIHFGGVAPRNVKSSANRQFPRQDFSQRFHVYTLEWYPDELRWFVDGEFLHKEDDWFTTKGSRRVPFPAPFNQRFHLLINLAVGGTFPGPPDSTTRFPRTMDVDYVRVYGQLP